MSSVMNFCTLFDSNYLSRGVALYRSLEEQTHDFHLYILAFDDTCAEVLNKLKLTHATVIALPQFEDEDLLRVKKERSRGEYCWTSTSSLILYCINTFQLANCTYLDADMYFYQSPKILLDEIPAECSVLITEHRYTKQYDQSATSGKYCVQFMYFRNDVKGMKVLKWWRDACIEWCYNRMEDGKFGDQKYLDSWTTQFDGVWELQHLGGGLAPWNCQQYAFKMEKNTLTGVVKKTKAAFRPVFYHYHGLRFYKNNSAIFADKYYLISLNVRKFFYYPYLKRIKNTSLNYC
ncbi:MAG: glycosyl transferase [Bacteroidota bacterium]